MLAEVPGCGAALQIGYVVYSKESKQSCLGVSLHTIDIFGLTNEEVAREMALDALKRSEANIALANTGPYSLRV
jgi:nicotinamide mononucleotide (NMN) deamidase PncC